MMCLALLVLAIGTNVSAQAGKVVIYSALDAPVTAAILQAFERASGLKTEGLTLPAAGPIATRIRAETSHPQADIFMGGSVDFHAPLAKDGLLAQYMSPRLAEAKLAQQFYSPEGYWYGWYIGALGIVYNRTRFQAELAPKGVRPPATWDDLTNAAFRGQLVLPSPIATGGGYIFVATQIFRLGDEDKAFAFLKQVAANASFTQVAPQGITLVSRGEDIVAMNWGHDIRSMAVNQGFPVELVFPPDTATELGTVSIIKGDPNPGGARQFVDFMLSRVPQDINAKFGLRYPTRVDAPGPLGMPPLSTLKFVNYNRQWAIDNMQRLRDRWQREVGK